MIRLMRSSFQIASWRRSCDHTTSRQFQSGWADSIPNVRAYLASMPDESRPKTKRESPQFTGKVVAALYESNLRMELSGRALIGAELGAKLGESGVDGCAPKSYRYELGGPPVLHATLTS
jgi:hypothetical protein